jgi:hypothetical protein
MRCTCLCVRRERRPWQADERCIAIANNADHAIQPRQNADGDDEQDGRVDQA